MKKNDRSSEKKFVDMLLRYRDTLGPQFQPAAILLDYAKTNKKFHP